MISPKIYLASMSPRRTELLTQIGIPHKVVPVDVDESIQAGEAAVSYVVRLAMEKAEAGLKAMPKELQLPVLAADTAVVLDDRILGKPANCEEAVEMMKGLSGRSHKVLTGVALAGRVLDVDIRETLLSASSVTFRNISESEALAYWQSGEPADKAGGYGIQGVGALFISHLEGSFSGVMGLPLFETGELLHSIGVSPITDQR